MAEKRLHSMIKDCVSSEFIDKYAWEVIPYLIKTGVWRHLLLFEGLDMSIFVENLVELLLSNGKINLKASEQTFAIIAIGVAAAFKSKCSKETLVKRFSTFTLFTKMAN